MGGRGSILSLHEIMGAYQAERRKTPDLTPHDFFVDSCEDIGFTVASEADRAKRRKEREHQAEVAAFAALLPPGYGLRVAPPVGGCGVTGHIGKGDSHGFNGWEAAICGARVSLPKQPEYATTHPLCETCRGMAPALAANAT